VIVERPLGYEDFVVALTFEGRMSYIRVQFRHQDPLGAGFWVIGLQLIEVLSDNDWPELKKIRL
jgi:hypothetical protein